MFWKKKHETLQDKVRKIAKRRQHQQTPKTKDHLVKKFMFIAVISLLSVNLCFNAIHYLALNRELSATKNAYLSKQLENQKINENIEKLKTDPTYIEKLAKYYYNMLKKGEFVYIKSK